MVSYPNFRVVLGCEVGIDDLILIKFNIKVGNKNDNKIISDKIQTSARVYSAHHLSNTCSIKNNV